MEAYSLIIDSHNPSGFERPSASAGMWPAGSRVSGGPRAVSWRPRSVSGNQKPIVPNVHQGEEAVLLWQLSDNSGGGARGVRVARRTHMWA